MFDYTVSPNNSPEIFKRACTKVEKTYPNALKHKMLVDVDGTTIQMFTENDKNILVYDDYDVGAVFIKSEIDLTDIF